VNPLTTGDFTESEEPFTLFKAWMAEAEASEPNDPNAMALATVDETGLPNVRMVLLKGADENGFVFYTGMGLAGIILALSFFGYMRAGNDAGRPRA